MSAAIIVILVAGLYMAVPRTNALPSYARVRELFNYDQQSGVLRWRVSSGSRAVIGAVAGCKSEGRIHLMVDGVRYKAHRIIWLWMTGREPAAQIDHRDLDGTNNRWLNLREATNSLNSANKRTQANKRTNALKGAYRMWNGSWYSRIQKDGVDYYLGCFSDAEAAHAAYAAKAQELFGEFARAA